MRWHTVGNAVTFFTAYPSMALSLLLFTIISLTVLRGALNEGRTSKDRSIDYYD